MNESIVYAMLPRGGLGNKLIVWARALVFSKKYGLKLYVSGWSELKIGPYLRGERVKRNYKGYFREVNRPNILNKFFLLNFYPVILDPDIEEYTPDCKSKVYLFKTLPSQESYFKGLRGHEKEIKAAFEDILGRDCLRALESTKLPIVGVHVRRGDFREPAAGQILGASDNLRIPITYYVDAINYLRRYTNKDLPVTVFTDGYEHEVRELLDLPNTSIAEINMDLVDLILLSKAKYIITSLGSTFSYWASFLSNAHIINHPAHKGFIRSELISSKYFEGTLSDNNLISNCQIKMLNQSIEI